MKNKIVDCLRDMAKAVLIGAAASAGIFAVFFLIGILWNFMNLRAALTLVRGAFFFIGAFALFICAGVLLKKDGGRKIQNREKWKETFHAVGLAPVVLTVAVVILASGMALDYWMYG